MQIIHSTSNSPSFNLAAEEYLFNSQTDDLLILYVNEPSVIIGNNQVVQNEVDVEFCVENNVEILRRMSGGGAVYHDLGNLNYCFIANRVEGKSALNADFLQPIVDILHTLSVPVTIGVRKDLWLPGGFKVSGTASHVNKKRELHHGTLLIDTNLDNLHKTLSPKNKNLLIKGTASVSSKVKNINTFLQESGSMFFIPDFLREIELYFKTTIQNIDEVEKIQEFADNKYKSREWNFKK